MTPAPPTSRTPPRPAAAPSTDPSETVSTEEASPIDDGGEVAVADFVARIQNGIKNTKYAHIVFSLNGGTGGMEGQGDTDYTVTPANMKMTMSISGQDMNLLLVDGVMYIESPQAPGKFLKYDLNDPSNPLGSQLDRPARPGRLDGQVRPGRLVGDVARRGGRRRAERRPLRDDDRHQPSWRPRRPRPTCPPS